MTTVGTPPTSAPPAWDLSSLDASAQRIGREVFQQVRRARPGPWRRQWWDERIMNWGMAHDSLKVHLFRFVDVLPMLDTADSVAGHLQEYLREVRGELPLPLRLGLRLAQPGTLSGRTIAKVGKYNAVGQARRFIAGETPAEVLVAAERQRRQRRAFTLDLLGEAVTSESEADAYLDAYQRLLDGIAPTVNSWPEVPQIDVEGGQPLPRVNLSVKLSALDSQFDGIDPQGTSRRVAARLRRLLRAARRHKAYVHVDMESYATKDLTLAIFQEVLLEDEFRDWPDVGIVIQCYLRDAGGDLVRLREWAERRGTPVWIRLVKGAYWDYETIHAQAMGWPIPVFQRKWESDANFEEQTRYLFAERAWLRPAIASHNVRSLAYALAVAEQLRVPADAYELQMLYGMADELKSAFVERGQRVRIYMPFGQLIPGMAYLVRRLLENTSNDSFLKASFTDLVSTEKLLMNPHDVGKHASAPAVATDGAVSKAANPLAEFRNEPLSDFALEANRKRMEQALADAAAQFGRHYPHVIDGREVDSTDRTVSLNPSHKRQALGTVAAGTAELAAQAVAAARRALPIWAGTSVDRRAAYLRSAAERIRQRRFELAAWIVHECGKPWREADADVAEAIDFCEYYATSALLMSGPQGIDVPGEENRVDYLPRGVAAVIAPWNFPLAILTGMTAAALVTGNPAIMKPAEQSPIVAAKLMEIFREIELPPGVVQLAFGLGETVGAALVEHPDVALIAFTGSRQVGLAIHRRAAEVSAAAPRDVKRVIAEMGGKNAIIVDADADLDEAVLGVARSAFGYQGQKCSACSRAIVVESVHEAFVLRLVEAARSLAIAPAEDPACTVGPVIDEEALARLRRYIELGKQEGQTALARDAGPLADEGYYVGPHIFAGVAPQARLAQEEIFGPVLAVIKARDFDQAIEILNGTDYALTGGLFSRSPDHLRRARQELLVGNLYLNRGITGALVGRQPFGGFRMSGIGSKAGGPDYLYQFVVPRCVTENTMRRGFAPQASQ